MLFTNEDPGTVPVLSPSTRVRRRRSWLPVYGFGLLFALAFLSLRILGSSAQDFLEQVYRSVGIFTGNGSWAFDGSSRTSTVFRILAILAPLMTALGLTELATGAVGPLYVRLVASLRRHMQTNAQPVALFGLGESSLGFARALIETGKFQPMIFASEQDELLLERATRLRIPVIPSPWPWWLRALDVCKRPLGTGSLTRQRPIVLPRGVADVVSFLPDVGAQIDLSGKLVRRLDAADGGPVPLRVSLIMADRGLAQRLDETLKFAHSQQGIHPRLIDLNALAARLLLTSHPLDVVADAFNQRQIHLAIYGFGALGRAVAKEAARLYVTRVSLDSIPLRITVLDRDPEVLRKFLAEDPGIDKTITIQAIDTRALAGAGLTAEDVARLIPDDVTAHVIAFGDSRSAFATAVSLRRWLLEPPPEVAPGWLETHRSTPIFIRMPDRSGIGKLVRSSVDRLDRLSVEVPNSIFAFGTREALFSPETLLGYRREAAAIQAHAVYLTSLAIANEPGGRPREAEQPWDALTPQLRDSDFHVVDHAAVKARAIGYRLDEVLPDLPPGVWPPRDRQLLLDVAQIEHHRYRAERQADGWRYAATRSDAVRVHPDLVPWEDLPEAEKRLDLTQAAALPQIVAALNQRLAEAYFIGVVGHRPDPARMDEEHVCAALKEVFARIRKERASRSIVLLTALAPGADTWAAEAALELGIPLIVPLPLPYETYLEDFATEDALQRFQMVIARAEYYIELPLRFGRVSELTQGRGRVPAGNTERRARQYALAGAYIVERAHQMIGVWDGLPAHGTGGTGEVISWTPDTVPAPFKTAARFRIPVQPLEKIVIPAKRRTSGP